MADPVHVKALDKKSRVKPTIRFFSYKNNCMLFCESYFEVECCLYRELDASVIAYVTQPITYSYDHYGKKRTYTPDALVKYKDGNIEFEEVKPIPETVKPKFIKKFEFIEELHRKIIKVPIILNTGQFKSKTQKANFEQLYNCLALPFDTDYWTASFEFLPKNLTLIDLQTLLKESKLDEMIAFKLIAKNIYSTDLNEKISLNSVLEKCNAALD